jgi:sugar phosphate isomerase/epimerase
MASLREAAARALEALEGGGESWRFIGPAIDALKAALEQPERHVSYVCPQCHWSLEQPERAQRMRDAGYIRRPTLREMAEEEQPEQEPVAVCEYCEKERPVIHAPRREWHSLSEEELAELAHQEQLLLICDDFDALMEIARAIEAELKELNHG